MVKASYHRRSHLSSSIKSYWDYKEELTIYDNLIFKRNKAVIPPVLRKKMVKIVHQPHLGVEACKRRDRKAFFGPKWTVKEIEQLVKSCSICNQKKPQQLCQPLKPRLTPCRPW